MPTTPPSSWIAPTPTPRASNLGLISGLTDRIGLITDELRAFARKTSAPPAPVAVREAVDGALLLVGPRLRQTDVRIVRREADEEALVMAERFRLEQVLVNLLQNALEALEGTPPIRRSPSRSRRAARRSGSSSPTTVPAWRRRPPRRCSRRSPPPSLRGLGLGLVISRDIVAEFGGELSLDPAAPTGARFVISLSKAR
jgi:two-component system C4-dicarboxylate transport sensor histidine kinase DctB